MIRSSIPRARSPARRASLSYAYMGLLPSIGSVPAATCPAGGDRLPLASRIADPRNLTSGRALLGPDHHPAYAGGGGNRSDGTLLVRRHSKPWIPAVARRPHRRGRDGGPVSP